MKKILSILVLLTIVQLSNAQKVETLIDTIHSSLRGLSVVTNQILWVSGSNGTVGKSTDAGKTWKWMTVSGFEKTDFRDIEAFDKNTAVIMGISEPAYILRTTDGGDTWKVVFKDKTKGMFLDAMEFWNDQSGIVIGDPIDGRFFIGRTFDGGKTWRGIPEQNEPVADSGEACFASSGTNIRKLNKAEAVFITGGLTSHIFIRNKKISLPILQGKESTGANSIAVKNSKTMIVVGGDFTKKEDTVKNCVITADGGTTWLSPKVAPSGYRSCVEYLHKDEWITCGLNGVDISEDDGMNWKNISHTSFHVCRKAKKGDAVYFAGNGKIGKLIIP
ncbi:MAG: oxidoreductase [Ginsengibacter sp.]